MSIRGIGTDLVQISRFERLWTRFGGRLAKRILSPAAYQAFKSQTPSQPANWLAKQFAAKEAVVKALGQGFRGEVFLGNIDIQRDVAGKPQVVFYQRTAHWFDQQGGGEMHLSLSDDAGMVIAFAVWGDEFNTITT